MTQYVPAKHTLLTDAERERLVLLIEECTEVIQAATKTLRWGYDDTHPGTGERNRDMVMRELRDLMTIKLIMERANDLPESTEPTQEKMVKLRRYMLHQSPEILRSVFPRMTLISSCAMHRTDPLAWWVAGIKSEDEGRTTYVCGCIYEGAR